MTKRAYCVLIGLLLIVGGTLHARQKVAVVLSGGGAKGVAHIGALKVLEEVGVPIDYIVGTSMGSIIGGLYATGYTPSQLDSILTGMDWNVMLTDKTLRRKQDLLSRERSDKFLLTIPFVEKPTDVVGGGVVKGRNIGKELWQMFESYRDSINFQDLPIPFACVAQDLVTGNEVVFQEGVLPVAIRSSMSIPGVFAPVSYNGMLLIDGGLVNNYPVDVARKMGADIIIGVDVQEPMKSGKEMQGNMLAQLDQLIDIQGKERWTANVAMTDVHIKVNVKGYSMASFTTEAIDSLIDRGEVAARQQLDALLMVREKTGKREPKRSAATCMTRLLERGEDQSPYYRILVGDESVNSLNLGVRFDNEELASLILNGKLALGKQKRNVVDLTVRLGKQTFVDAQYNLNVSKKWMHMNSYRYTYNDFNLYSRGERVAEINFNEHSLETAFAKSWNRFRIKMGARLLHYHYASLLFRYSANQISRPIEKETYLKFGVEMEANTLNDGYFPTEGFSMRGQYFYVLPFHHTRSFYQASIKWKGAYSANSRLTFLPRLEGRYISLENVVAEMNYIGGQESGKYFEQQIPVYGINHFERGANALTLVGVDVRQRLFKRHYVTVGVNAVLTSDTWSQFFKHSFGSDDAKGFHVFGGALRYDYRTFLGPVGLTLQYSDRSKFSGYVRAGFDF